MESLATLIKRTLSGDLNAYTAIVRRFQNMALGYSYSLLGDFHLAEDAAQEAFIQAYLDLSKLNDYEAFPGWFRRIVFKHCDRILRKRRVSTVPLEMLDPLPSMHKDPAAILEEEEMKQRLHAAIRSLSERERQVTTLFYIGEHAHKEIASFLEVTPATVDNLLRASRKKLRERISEMAEFRKEVHSKGEHLTRDVMNRLEAIENLHTAFVRSLGAAFSEVLKKTVGARIAFADLTPYEEVVKAISLVPSCTYTVTMAPLNGDAILSLYVPLLHCLLGSELPKTHPLKKEEVGRVNEMVAKRAFKALEAVWKSHGITLKNLMVETDPKSVNLASPADSIIIIGIEIHIEGYAGEDLNPRGPKGIRPAACLCYPVSTLASLLPAIE